MATQRSFLAAYGPVIAVGAVLIVTAIVLFSLPGSTSPPPPPESQTDAPAPLTPTSEKYDGAVDRVSRLYRDGKRTFDALSKEDKAALDALTNGEGALAFAFCLKKLEARANPSPAAPNPPGK